MKAPARGDADQRTQEFRVSGNDGGRQPALAHQRGGTVGVGQHPLEQFGTLHEPGLEGLPLGRIDQQRQVAQRPRPFGSSGILVDPIEHAGIVQMPISRDESTVDLVAVQAPQDSTAAVANAGARGRSAPSSRRKCRAADGSPPTAAQRGAVRARCRRPYDYPASLGRLRSSVIGYSSERSSAGRSKVPGV